MKSQAHLGRTFQFSFPKLDTLILVEELPSEVVIRATRNTFGEPRKIAFIRHLVDEGFIGDDYRWRAGGLPPGVRWVIDHQWLAATAARGNRRKLILPLIGGATAAWLATLATLLLMHSH
jgi:hypothetical protein